jgi:hypothetical protein
MPSSGQILEQDRQRAEPRLITPGVIAQRIGAPLHRVLHVLSTRRHIRPAARAGTLRLYATEAVVLVRRELSTIDARRRQRHSGVLMHSELTGIAHAPLTRVSDPRALTAEGRLAGLADLLATGMRRMLSVRAQLAFDSPQIPLESRQNDLDVCRKPSVHVPDTFNTSTEHERS